MLLGSHELVARQARRSKMIHSMKWILAVCLLLVACSAPADKGLGTQLEKGLADSAAQNTADAAKTAAATVPQAINEVVLERELAFKDWPTAVSVKLDELVRYRVQFSIDKPAQVVVYSEQRYNQWKETGSHTISKASTKTVDGCCQQEASWTFDVNQGEGGTYYVVFDTSKVTEKPTTGSLKVTKATTI
jgi:hypothetical protein